MHLRPHGYRNDNEMCVMNATNGYLGRSFRSVANKEVGKLLTSFLVDLNDCLQDTPRQALLQLIPFLKGTTTFDWEGCWYTNKCFPDLAEGCGLVNPPGFICAQQVNNGLLSVEDMVSIIHRIIRVCKTNNPDLVDSPVEKELVYA